MRAASLGIAVAAAVARTWKPALVGLLGFQSTARPEVVRVDGVRLEVRSVEFRASPPETLARLRESWGEPQILRDGEHGAAPVRYVFGRQDGPRHLTLTLAERERGRLGGVLAVQMPRNFDAPSHTLIAATAHEPPWRDTLEPLIKPAPVHSCTYYHRLLAPLAAEIDVWETRYLHALHGEDPVKEWTKGTWLRPFLAALPETERPAFEASYARKLREAYPKGADDITLFEFNRLFLVMRRR